MFTDKINLLQDEFFIYLLCKFSFLLFVVSLRGITQQPANRLQTDVRIYLFYFLDCWVPGFFLIETLSCFSAMLIIVSSASALSFSHCSCFSSRAIMNSLMDHYPLVDGCSANAILGCQLPIPSSPG